jgi:hypothetical protein
MCGGSHGVDLQSYVALGNQDDEVGLKTKVDFEGTPSRNQGGGVEPKTKSKNNPTPLLVDCHSLFLNFSSNPPRPRKFAIVDTHDHENSRIGSRTRYLRMWLF